jgi:acyl-CoA synthetase (AMP-forming)/AMP-acid ligase II
MSGWPRLAGRRWTDEQQHAFHAAGIWRAEGLEALAAGQARVRPDALATADETRELTWAQCVRELRAVAAGLVDAGVTPGAVVALRMANSVDHLVLLLAIAAAGAVAFELPPDSTPEQVAAGLRRTGAVALFSDARAAATEVDALATPALSARTGAEIAGDPDAALPGSDPDAVGLLLGTSGTTGTPKIVMRTANASLAMARHVTSRTHVGPDDVVLLAAPLAGGIGYFNGLCTAVEHGCPIVLAPTFAAAAVLAQLQRYRVTVLQTVPTVLRRMAEAPEAASTDTSSLRLVQSGGAYLHSSTATLIESSFGCHVISAYGAVDVGTPTMVDAVQDTAAHRHETVGPPYADSLCELAILDEAGEPLATGQTGEVAMRGPNMALGYFEDEAATAELFDARGWGHFGDLGQIGDDGYLRIVGRVKEIINRGGKKLSIEQIEGHVRGFPGLRDVAAVGYDDPDLGERCAAVVVCEPWLTLSVEKLSVYLTQRGVPKQLWPERIEQIDELPLSPQGKVRRRELRETIAQRSAS